MPWFISTIVLDVSPLWHQRCCRAQQHHTPYLVPLFLCEGVLACPTLEQLCNPQLVSSHPQGVPKGISGVLTDNSLRR